MSDNNGNAGKVPCRGVLVLIYFDCVTFYKRTSGRKLKSKKKCSSVVILTD